MSQAHSLTGISGSEDVWQFSVADNEIVLANISDYGVENADEEKVASMVRRWQPNAIFTNGDNSQAGNDYDDDVQDYYGAWVNRDAFWPCPGNHDWDDGTLEAYFAYFTTVASLGYYYSVTIGPITLFMLDGNEMTPDGRIASSRQAEWLASQVASCRSPWKVASIHQPPYSSCATHGSQENSQWDYSGLDIVFSGHTHVYERLYIDGMWYVVNGLGGQTRYNWSDTVAGSVFQYNADFGAGKLLVTPKKLTWRFYRWDGQLVDALSLEK